MKPTQDQNILNNRQFILQKREEEILDPSSAIYKQIAYHHKFRKRTFILEPENEADDYNFIDHDEVKLKL